MWLWTFFSIRSVMSLVFLSFLMSSPVIAKSTCARIRLLHPNYAGDALTVEENQTVNITLRVEDINCTNLQGSTVEVTKIDKNKTYTNICSFQLDSCRVSSRCECSRQFGQHYILVQNLIRNVKREDTAKWRWRWSTISEKADDFSVNFNVTYETQLTNLTVGDYSDPRLLVVKLNRSVRVVCSWEKGNPPVSVRLLDNYSNTLNSSNSSETSISHEFFVTRCHEEQIVSCVAEDSNKTRSASLLAECLPKFNMAPEVRNRSTVEGDVHNFTLFAHSSNITSCQVLMEQSKTNAALVDDGRSLASEADARSDTWNCSVQFTERNGSRLEQCACGVTGVPPNLTLSLYLGPSMGSMTLYSLYVSNEIGSDRLDFCPQSNQGKSTLTPLNVTEVTNNVGNRLSVVVYIYGLVVGIITVIVIVIIYKALKKRQKNDWLWRNKPFLQESSDKDDSVSVALPVVLNKPPDTDTLHPFHVSAVNDKNMAPSVCQTLGLQEASSEDKGITFTCQGSDVRKIVIHFGEKAASPKPSHLSNSDPNGVHCFPTPVEPACTLETATEHSCSDENRMETTTTGAGSSSNRFGNAYSPSPIASQHSSLSTAAGETSYYDQRNRTAVKSLENVFEHYENMHCSQSCASHCSSVEAATEHGCYDDWMNSGTKVPVENDYLTPCELEYCSMQSNKGEQRDGLTPLVAKDATATALSDYYIFADNTNRYDAESSEEEKYATIENEY